MKTIVKLGSLDPLILPGKGAGSKIEEFLKSDEKVIAWSADIEVIYVAENIDELKVILDYNKSHPVIGFSKLSTALEKLPENIKLDGFDRLEDLR